MSRACPNCGADFDVDEQDWTDDPGLKDKWHGTCIYCGWSVGEPHFVPEFMIKRKRKENGPKSSWFTREP